ncbi:hypothetical protein A9404_06320 [Halothiobacillus diazotrophicus]|uniref:Ferritin/DPS domain-containing protein n=1 Tax=Halothiobacillus diazotrophicus TaxID=1860122 RepID=A0A191ZGR5_9GAMM|nr:ferritin-like domain-containing protein [Halothiobacillus diazotrophicus]ANJ67048.1 hypothetical protein A9404_06320 [Halothiobacillus diazotrophicus]
MRIHPRITAYVMRGLEHEFNTVQQFQTRAALAELWSETELAESYRHKAIHALSHVERLTQTLFLMGVAPNSFTVGAVRPGQNPAEMQALSIAQLQQTVHLYDDACQFCLRIRDAEHHALFQSFLDEALKHYWQELQTQAAQAI